MKQEAIEFEFTLLDGVKTEPAEEAEAACLGAPSNHNHDLGQNKTNYESDGHFKIAVDILEELISNAVELSFGIEKKTVTDHL